MKLSRVVIFLLAAVFSAPAYAASPQVVASVAALRAGNFVSYPNISLTAYIAGSEVGGGDLLLDAGDTTSADNGCTIFVDAASHRFKRVKQREYSLAQCGAVGDGSTNDYAAVVRMFASVPSAGAMLTVDPGRYAMPSASISQLLVPANIVVNCAPGNNSTFLMTGVAQVDNWFTVQDKSNVVFNNCAWYGNSVATGATNAGAIWVDQTGATAVNNFQCNSCKFENFKQPFWVRVSNHGSTPMYGFRFTNPIIRSYSGNDINSASISQPADAFEFFGQFNSANGTVQDITIDGMDCDALYIKKCVTAYDGTQGLYVTNFVARNCGMNTSPDSGGYCLMAYWLHNASGTKPNKIFMSNGSCLSPFSNCIYMAEVENIFVSDVYCSAQSDTADTVLLKGCVSLNEPTNASVSGLICEQSFNCFGLQNGSASTVHLTNMSARGSFAAATGMRIVTVPSGDALSHFFATSPDIFLTSATSVGTYLRSGAGQNPGTVSILGGRIAAGAFDIQTYDTTSLGGVISSGVTLGGGLYLNGASTTASVAMIDTATPLVISDLVIDGTAFAAAAIGLNLTDATNISIDGLSLRNKASGAGTMLSIDGARGSMAGVQYSGVGSSQRVTSSDFGVALPNWTADIGTSIQNLNEACSAGAFTSRWANDNGSTTWTPRTGTC